MPLRKALFSKPAWAAKSPEPFQDEQPADIFQQNVYEDILQEKRKKEEHRRAKDKERGKQHRKAESESRETRSDEDRTVKKRRISKTSENLQDDGGEDDDFDETCTRSDSDGESTSNGRNRKQKSSPIEAIPENPTSRRKRDIDKPHYEKSKTPLPQEPETNAITVGSDDDDDDLVIYDVVPIQPTEPGQTQPDLRSKPKPPLPPESGTDSDSDPDEDEWAKTLKRKARAEARAKRRQAAAKQAGTTTDPSAETDALSSLNTDARSTTTATTTTADQNVHIYIQSILPNCPPLGIIRRPSQTLESVHTYFCETHKLGDILREKTFFAWNNQRLYKSTTMKSILNQIKFKNNGVDRSEGRIVLEAVTEEILAYRKEQEAKAKRRAEEGGGDADDEEQVSGRTGGDNDHGTNSNGLLAPADAPGIPLPTNTSTGVVIKLTSATPDLPSMQLRVHAHTTIEKIVRGYKKRMEVDVAREVYLVFEGERMEGERTVADVGFEDGDCVDVRCK